MSFPSSTCGRIDEATSYYDLEKLVRERIAAAKGIPIFTTDASGLWEAYLGGIAFPYRQHYNCNTCKRFIERYGGLVTIRDSGRPVPLLWSVDNNEEPFLQSQVQLHNAVANARVTGVFLESATTLGTPITRAWTHLSGINPNVFHHPLLSAFQVMAEKAEDYATLRRGLSDYSKDAVVQAVRVLEADAVDRSEKTLGVSKWLLDLHTRIEHLKGRLRDNVVWFAVATAPPGWCHIRTTMISTLLDDIVQGNEFETIQRRWNEKMHPLQYQRPTALSEGNIEQANKIVAKLGSEGALARRYATLDDVLQFEWKYDHMRAKYSTIVKVGTGGAFDHLMPHTATRGRTQVKEVQLPAKKISWEKFKSDVLPHALEISLLVPTDRASFYGLVTAANPGAPPILQWDSTECRNPVSWYFRYIGAYAHEYALTAGSWAKVTGIFRKPPFWTSKATHHEDSPFFALEGAIESQRQIVGGGFFPECLRSEYHAIRKAMESYARTAPIEGREEGNANGIALHNERSLHVSVRTQSVGLQEYDVTLF